MSIDRLFGCVVYFVFASLSYLFVFDRAAFTHPKYLKNQIRQEIRQTMISLPCMAIFTTPIFFAEVRGYANLYDDPSEAPFRLYNFLQFPFFIAFTDFLVYWIHRGLHHPRIYKTIHKAHHKWIMPTPYASHAFHPVDGFSQGIPYHAFPFIFPLQKFAYIVLFVFVNVWTIMIRKHHSSSNFVDCFEVLISGTDDGEYMTNSPVINGAACHTMHHLYFNYNYGQFTTLWDRLGGSYRQPNAELFKKESKMSKAEWDRQVKEMEVAQKGVEGEDDRDYSDEMQEVQKKIS